jgi:TPR repeat protein
MRRLLVAAVLWLACGAAAQAAAGLDEADALIEKGEFAAALEALLPFAYQGIAEAQYKVGVLFDYGQQAGGRGVPQNPFEALKWYRKAAEQGHARAQRNLASLYEAGRGSIADATEAARWYRAAALQGDSYAQFSLGRMYRDGRGVTRQLDRAYAWLARAVARGLLPVQRDEALQIMKAIEIGMSPEELDRARQMANAPAGSRLAP